MNRLLADSNAARIDLKRHTAMDDLDYELLILESGIQFLGLVIRFAVDLDSSVAAKYGDHLCAQGYWNWFAAAFRRMEVDTWKKWKRDDLTLLQSDAYKRKYLIELGMGMALDDTACRSFDAWLGLIDLKMSLPAHQH